MLCGKRRGLDDLRMTRAALLKDYITHRRRQRRNVRDSNSSIRQRTVHLRTITAEEAWSQCGKQPVFACRAGPDPAISWFNDMES